MKRQVPPADRVYLCAVNAVQDDAACAFTRFVVTRPDRQVACWYESYDKEHTNTWAIVMFSDNVYVTIHSMSDQETSIIPILQVALEPRERIDQLRNKHKRNCIGYQS